ncbi:MAG TPA: hypothetical protein ENK84_03560 [Desulfobulbus sp.]|nr:hypothetical protein [Desulfobulbus sp.]
MNILLNGKENLEELFAEIGETIAEKKWGLSADTGRILPGFRALAGMPSLPDKLIQSLTGNLDMCKSN